MAEPNLPRVYNVDQLGKISPPSWKPVNALPREPIPTRSDRAAASSTPAYTILHEGTLQQANYFNDLQKIALTQTRLEIQLLEDEEGTHGAKVSRATVFP